MGDPSDISAEVADILATEWWGTAYVMLKGVCRHTGPDLGLHASVDGWFSLEELCLKVNALGRMTPGLVTAAIALEPSKAFDCMFSRATAVR